MIRNGIPATGSATGAINAFSQQGDDVYATGYTYGRAGGTLEGVAKMSWDGGTLDWVADCHGDSYGTDPMGDAVYVVGHAHYCGNLPDGFDQPGRGSTSAVSRSRTRPPRRCARSTSTTPTSPGHRPLSLHWYPRIDSGSFTGQTQGAWAVTGNDDYVVAGGEFPRVNGTNQQGLVRFAVTDIAPNDQGTELNGASTNPTVRSVGAGQVLVSWEANWDRDNRELTYEVVRNNNLANPVAARTFASADWDLRHQSFLDTGLTPGSTVTYRIVTRDPMGNETRSDLIEVQVAGSGSVDDYARAVAEDGPQHYWRLDESSGTDVAGFTGNEDATTYGGVNRGVPGAISGNRAAAFNGTSSQTASNAVAEHGRFWYTVEAWFNTTTNRGGKIVGFGSERTGNSSSHDRHLYMDNNGRLNFGSRQNGQRRIVTSPGGLNNGQWHHAVGVQSPDEMLLYVDGRLVGTRNDTRTGHSYDGYWRIGGDNLSGWNNRPTSDYFQGSIDEVAVYSHALTGNDVRDHYIASGLSAPQPPSDAYGQAVYQDGPDSYWRLAETGGTDAADASLNDRGADYVGGPTLGQPSGIGLAGDRSVGFDGANDVVAADSNSTAPERFSAETWFRTTTGDGGRLIGFGSSRTGTSSNADRHVYMTDTGRLRFGTVRGGVRSVIESPQAYNDGDWHHLVATQGTAGMQLHVDGVRVAENGQSLAADYSGYWRLGGDNLSGWDARPSSDYFAGSLDEAAVYSRVLGAAEISEHFTKGAGVAANQPPTANFTWEVTSDLEVSFNDDSSDADGSIVSREWTFGDGATSSATNPTHTYASGGEYTVTLTVNDDEGATDSTSDTVTVTEAPNQPPSAEFSVDVVGQEVSVDASGSSDDGSIVSYVWGWGDGSADGSGVEASHTYADGSYTVTLTVTDDEGETDTASQLVSVGTAPGPFAADAFARNVSGGWGSADVGGAWATSGPGSRWSVSGGAASYTAPSAGTGHWAFLNSVSQADVEGTVDVSMDKPITGTGISWAVGARRNGETRYQFITRIQNDRDVRAWIVRRVSGAETQLGARVTVPIGTFNDGDVLRTRFRVVGSSPAALAVKVWKAGTPEPAEWHIERTDTGSALPAGSVGLYSYLYGSATNAPVASSWDNLSVTAPGGGGGDPEPPANQPPSAEFSVDVVGQEVSVDASGSSDDGSIVSYVWGWGDGSADGSGVEASHTYADGSYTVTLTVTDDEGETDTASQLVSVGTAPGPFAADAFARNVSGGWGSADVGGAWATSGPGSRWSVSGGAASYTAPSAGTGHWAFLNSVSQADVEGTVDVSMDKPITGTGISWAVGARRNGETRYQFITRIQNDRDVRAWIVRRVSGAETQLGARVTVPIGTFNDGDVLRTRFRVVGELAGGVGGEGVEGRHA